MKFLDKISSAKMAFKCLKEGEALLAAQNIEASDYDDQWLIESKDFAWSFPFFARAIKKGMDKLIVLEPQKPEVYCGIQADYANREYCEKNNISVVCFPTQGGAIFCNKGDMLLIFAHKNRVGEFQFLDFIKPRIVHYLKNVLPNSVIVTPNNDIEIDGRKVSGSTTASKFGSLLESIVIFGVNSSEHVNALGHKGKIREVAGLSDFGIDLTEFRTWLLDSIRHGYENHGIRRERRSKRRSKGRKNGSRDN